MAVFQGIGLGRGIAIGPAFLYRPAPLEVGRRRVGRTMEELARFESALQHVQAHLRALRAAIPSSLRLETDRLLEAQVLLLADPALVDRTRGAILEGRPAEQAWQEAVEAYLSIFASIQAEDLRARAADLHDVGRSVLSVLLGRLEPAPFATARGAVLVAEMLGPNEALQLAAQPPRGLCLAGGTPTAPVAVVARRLELPAAIGLGEDFLRQVRSGQTVVVDGSTGLVELDPEPEVLAYYRERQRLLQETRPARDVSAPAVTADGWRVDVRVDLERPDELFSALAGGAEGIGLARTDFLFLGRESPPGEQEQLEAYGRLLEQAPAGRVFFCTLSAGPEAALPFAAEPELRNPLLGLRGVRLSLAYLSAFREQLRAILRAGAGRPIGVVFPMAETLAELRAALEWLERARLDLQNAGLPQARDVAPAVLLQTPLAVLGLEALAGEEVAFFLDLDRLTEYLTACDRRNLRVAHLFRPLHPVVLRLVQGAVETLHRRGKRLDVCGESAGSPGAVALLLGLGVDGFCLPAERIAGAKVLLAHLSIPEAQALAREALSRQSAAEVEGLVENVLESRRAS
ncbi:MAG: phosphoenolpyruvate--protein phosphotransferase [Chloroflexia bacterium]